MTRRIHLASGLILFTFATTHLINHALGLISLDAMEAGRQWFLQIWRTAPGTIVLYGALLVHLLLALWAIFRRRTFQLNPAEWAQLLLGLSIPVLLTAHMLGTRMAHELFGQQDTYTLELAVFFVIAPDVIYKQMALLLVVWAHGTIGVHRWLRLKPAYRNVQWLALSAALLLPAAALAGVWTAGRDIVYLTADQAWLDQLLIDGKRPGTDQRAYLGQLENWILAIAAGMLAAVLLLRPLRRQLRRKLGLVQITYPGGARVTVTKGTSVLEASNLHRIPHASVCGGRGRCSTCRVRVGQGLEQLALSKGDESRILKRINAAQNVRLACQIRPERDCAVTPLLPPATTANAVGPEPDYLRGQEREIAVLFADMRGFTALSEQKLPFDVVFLLNRYFASMGGAVARAGGHVDKFVGDGVMALFGLETGLQEASRSALRAVRFMDEELAKLNRELEQDLPEPLRLAIGLHSGPVIIGSMGYGEAIGVTAIGDTVNAASRLEAVAKSFDVQLVVSRAVAEAAGVPVERFKAREIDVRGRKERLVVHLIPDASALRAGGHSA